jgi:thiol:disulfide interchange protein/DsbC/DsbD-like thiol-disulfide interchange protein
LLHLIGSFVRCVVFIMKKITFLLVYLIVRFASAQAVSASVATRSTMFVEDQSIVAGEPFTVALQLEHPLGWHSYYLNSGGIELPLTIKWELPLGFSVGPVQWPVPTIKEGFFGKSFVYSGSPIFLVTLNSPNTLVAGNSISLKARAGWQICEKSCINEHNDFSLTLNVAPLRVKNSENLAVFELARSLLPTQNSKVKATAISDGGDIQLRVEMETAPTDFIPDQPFVQPASTGGSILQDGTGWILRLKRAKIDMLDHPIPQGSSVSGILLGTTATVLPETSIAAAPLAIAAALPWAKYFPLLGSMMLGGLILNLMPCVFPVIGLKIMGFVQQAGSDRKKIALHGITFTLGVLASFGVISGILFAARSAAGAATANLGWGYQLQNPWVVLVVMLLMFVLALNMFGLFELGTSATSVGGNMQTKQGLGGSFFSGVLATIVATPCSGPFLGVAIGAAIVLPAFQFFSAFAAMALGLAIPYLVLSVFPKLIKFLPRPGAWMESFKQAMSFLLFAATGYFLWVYAGQIGVENLLAPIFGLSGIAIAAWIYGRWYLPHRSRLVRYSGLILSLIFVVVGILLVKPPEKSLLIWEPWSSARELALLDAGTPVFIDFTAQWCATCQVNKKRAYTSEVVALMKRKGIVALRADKTLPNPAIETRLRELDRSAIPVNVLLLPNRPPAITAEFFSASDLITLFNQKLPDR